MAPRRDNFSSACYPPDFLTGHTQFFTAKIRRLVNGTPVVDARFNVSRDCVRKRKKLVVYRQVGGIKNVGEHFLHKVTLSKLLIKMLE